MALSLRLYRELDGTEITNTSTRLPLTIDQWTIAYAEEPDEDGAPVPVSITNNATMTFPGPSILDLGSALSRVAAYLDYSAITPERRVAQSSPLLLLNFLTQILLVNYVIFAPGQLTLTVIPS